MISFVIFTSARSNAGLLLNSMSCVSKSLTNIKNFPWAAESYLQELALQVSVVTHTIWVFSELEKQALDQRRQLSNAELSFNKSLCTGMGTCKVSLGLTQFKPKLLTNCHTCAYAIELRLLNGVYHVCNLRLPAKDLLHSFSIPSNVIARGNSVRSYVVYP
jgi:hypothetical protein